MGFAFLTVSVVILFVTFNLKASLIVLFVVGLTNVYMIGLIYYWGLTLNIMIIGNLGFSLGITIDYAVHISHRYLNTEPPEKCKTNKEKRAYKISIALSKMGSSVFHSGISTLLAISMMAFAGLYSFEVFWKTWTIMIVFGLLNGMILQSIILSFIGPIQTAESNG